MKRIRRKIWIENSSGRRYYHDLGSNKIIGRETSLIDEVFNFFKLDLGRLPMGLLKLSLIPGLIALGWHMRDKTYHPETVAAYEALAVVDDDYLMRLDPNLSNWTSDTEMGFPRVYTYDPNDNRLTSH
ncbi:hypothetical protein A3K73_04885 [Candidatus Pacearchaeota archaeon RBG_13_36_9]|nr:MAG: hypothetical protein A3K73_04885 [Candidatus Pacearchaeota archaeon RBG_13_36_9]